MKQIGQRPSKLFLAEWLHEPEKPGRKSDRQFGMAGNNQDWHLRLAIGDRFVPAALGLLSLTRISISITSALMSSIEKYSSAIRTCSAFHERPTLSFDIAIPKTLVAVISVTSDEHVSDAAIRHGLSDRVRSFSSYRTTLFFRGWITDSFAKRLTHHRFAASFQNYSPPHTT